MVQFSEEDIFPRFIREDENGNALVKSISCALHYMASIIQDGKDAVINVDRMPEWRLDEMAWETNCIYDYKDNIDEKRGWIRDAMKNQNVIGTPYGLKNYLDRKFIDSLIEEADYPGWQPFHFRIMVSGEYSFENASWAIGAVERYKNVRSVMDSFTFNGQSAIAEGYINGAIVGEEIVSSATAN